MNIFSLSSLLFKVLNISWILNWTIYITGVFLLFNLIDKIHFDQNSYDIVGFVAILPEEHVFAKV